MVSWGDVPGGHRGVGPEFHARRRALSDRLRVPHAALHAQRDPEGTLRCTGQRVQMQELRARNTPSEDS